MPRPISFRRFSIRQFIKSLSGPDPIPGGGSASALVGTVACSLAEMVGGIFWSRARSRGVKKRLARLLRAVRSEKNKISEIIDEDPKAFGAVMEAYRTPKRVRNRRARIDQALLQAYEVQKELALSLISLKKANRSLKTLVDGSIRNDLLLSEAFTKAAFEGAYRTAEINWKYLKDKKARAKLAKELRRLRKLFRRS